jgi:hypothetical protein
MLDEWTRKAMKEMRGVLGKKMICLFFFYLPFKSLSCFRLLPGRREKELGIGERVG